MHRTWTSVTLYNGLDPERMLSLMVDHVLECSISGKQVDWSARNQFELRLQDYMNKAGVDEPTARRNVCLAVHRRMNGGMRQFGVDVE